MGTQSSTGPRQAQRLDRDAWVAAAREALIAGGIASVKIEPLAAHLGVTTGSFYWHFADRGELLDALLEDWVVSNTEEMEGAIQANAGDGERQFEALVQVWVEPQSFSPQYDSALRDWARTSKKVETAVRRVDRHRIALLKAIYLNLGYSDERAEARAQIMYFHQVGYYALGVKGPTSLRPYYIEALRDGVGKGERLASGKKPRRAKRSG